MKRILAAVDMTPGSKLVFDAASALAEAIGPHDHPLSAEVDASTVAALAHAAKHA